MCKKIVKHNETLPVFPANSLRHEKKRASKVEADILAVLTYETKLVFNAIANLTRKVKSSSYYRILTSTTQPAHLAVILAVVFLSTILYPLRAGPVSHHAGYKFVYATATAIHYGSQIWMTFISGLSLYFSLPRHDFGEVQKVLFPIYFTFTGILSAAAIYSQSRLSGLTGTTLLLSACFMVELLVRVRFCGPLVALIIKKNRVEAKHGLGREVGKLASDSSLYSSKGYVSLHKQFRRLHMVIAISNMVCIGLSTFHIWFSLQSCPLC